MESSFSEQEISNFYRRWMEPATAPVRWYHRFRIVGHEHLPKSGPALIVVTHSQAYYDLFLVPIELHRQTGRVAHGLAADFWFDVPLLRSTIGRMGRAMGGIRATQESARQLLREGKVLGVLPGGTLESLRPPSERFQIRWEDRFGFVRLALETQAPVVLATCPGGELIYDVYPTPITQWVYRRWRLPLTLVRGWGPTLIPRPIPLTCYFAPAIVPPSIAGPNPTQGEVVEFHASLCRAMRGHIRRSVEQDGWHRRQQAPQSGAWDRG